MRTAFVGSRKGAAYAAIDREIGALLVAFGGAFSIVTGGARGVDSQSEALAYAYGLDGERVRVHPAAWVVDGKYRAWAGLERNAVIVSEADLVVAFIEPRSRGTADTVHKALSAGKPLRLLSLDGSVWPACPCGSRKCPARATQEPI